jgi:hypothetical protein
MGWESIPKPSELASFPRCVICRLAVEIEKRTNIYCWNCWKICIRPDTVVQYDALIKYALETAMKNPKFHGKFFKGRGRPVLVIRASSEEERDMLFAQILEDLKERGLYPKDPKKRWWRRGCDYFNPILGKWKNWTEPKPLSKETISKILQLSKKANISRLGEW